MRLRTLVLLIALSLLIAPLPAEAQQAKASRIGVLSLVAPRSAHFFQAFEQRLRELGWIDGQNLIVEFRTAEGKAERLSDLAAELIRRPIDLIVASGVEATLRAAMQATSTVPIVIVAVDYDPIARGYVAGLARPGGTITGVFVRQPELTAKRLELLKQTLPKLSRVAVLWDAFSADQLRAAETAAPAVGVRLQPVELRDLPYDMEGAIRASKKGRAEALLVLTSPAIFRERARTAELALKYRIPAAFALSEWVELGGLMSYGVNVSDMLRRAAEYVDKILKGAKPADLPVEQPTRFEFVINLKTAKALGLTIPQSILLRADKLIE